MAPVSRCEDVVREMGEGTGDGMGDGTGDGMGDGRCSREAPQTQETQSDGTDKGGNWTNRMW